MGSNESSFLIRVSPSSSSLSCHSKISPCFSALSNLLLHHILPSISTNSEKGLSPTVTSTRQLVWCRISVADIALPDNSQLTVISDRFILACNPVHNKEAVGRLVRLSLSTIDGRGQTLRPSNRINSCCRWPCVDASTLRLCCSL